MKFKLVGIALLFSHFAFAQNPTATQVLENYVKAIGGKAKLEAVKDLTRTITSTVQGMAVTVVNQHKEPQKFKSAVEVTGMGEVQSAIFDGQKVVSKSMQGSNTSTSGAEFDLAKTQSEIFPELYYLKNKTVLNLAGKETVNGKEAYKIEVKISEEVKIIDFYEVASGLKIKQTIVAKIGETPSLFSNYKEIDGIKYPFTIKTNPAVGEMTLEVQSIEVNKGIADDIFVVK